VVQDHANDIAIKYMDNSTNITSPPLPPPVLAPTLRLPKSTKTIQPQWMDESTVRITSCPATGVQDSESVDAIDENEDAGSVDDNDGEYLEIENALPGCFLQLPSSLLKTVSTRRKLSVKFDIANIDVIEAPQYVADPYRATSISKVLPLPGVISTWWSAVPYPHTSRFVRRRNIMLRDMMHVRRRADFDIITATLHFAAPSSWLLNRALTLHRTLCGRNMVSVP
jgi:hypothetical protein